MKRFLVFLLLLPVLGISQTKNVLNSFRVYPKSDKVTAFGKALANHAQKFHTGDWKWRVWSIESGPHAGGYMITEGPNSWEAMDKRGDISPEHTADWDNNVSPLTADRGTSDYFTFKPDLSTVELTDYADKILINHMTAKPGQVFAVNELIKKLKNVWTSGKESIAVYSVTASGDPGFVTVTRLKEGLKELADGYRKPIDERYNEANGANSWNAYLKDYASAVERRWSELLIYHPELSSK